MRAREDQGAEFAILYELKANLFLGDPFISQNSVFLNICSSVVLLCAQPRLPLVEKWLLFKRVSAHVLVCAKMIGSKPDTSF